MLSDEAIALALAAEENGFPTGETIDPSLFEQDDSVEDEWQVKVGKKSRRRKSADDSEAIAAVGLGNRYGENNCYLNVVLQTLYRLSAFKKRFCHEYETKYKAIIRNPSAKHPRQVQTAASLLSAFHEMFVKMDLASRAIDSFARGVGSEAGTEGMDAALSLSSLRSALHHALVEREAFADLHRSTPKKSVGTSSTTAGAAFVSAVGSRAMADAAEAMEEIITLLHESEATINCVGNLATASAATLLTALEGLQSPSDPESNTFSKRLELSVNKRVNTSASLSAFGQLVARMAVCPVSDCKYSTDATIHTGIAQHINTLMLLRFRAINMKRKVSLSFGKLIKQVLEDEESRMCSVCKKAQLRTNVALLRPTSILTVTLGWLSSRDDSETVDAVLDSIDGFIDLMEVFHQRGPAADVVKALTGDEYAKGVSLPARLRGFVCYINNHWVAFFDQSRDKTPAWVCCNDEKVFKVEFPVAHAAVHRLQPSMLFYETGMVGDAMPADRGRAALHGDGKPLARIPLSVAISAGVPDLVLDSKELFPSLPPTKPKPVVAADTAAETAAIVEESTTATDETPSTSTVSVASKPKWASLAAAAPVKKVEVIPADSTTTAPTSTTATATPGAVPPAAQKAVTATTGAPAPAPTAAAPSHVSAHGKADGRGRNNRGDNRGRRTRDTATTGATTTTAPSEPLVDEDGFQLVGKAPKPAATDHRRYDRGGGRGGRGRGRGRGGA